MLVSIFVLPAALLFTVVSIVSSVLILGIISEIVLAAISLITFVCMVMDVQAITGRRGALGLACGVGAGRGCGAGAEIWEPILRVEVAAAVRTGELAFGIGFSGLVFRIGCGEGSGSDSVAGLGGGWDRLGAVVVLV